MRLSTTLTLLTICLTAIGQTFPTKRNSWNRVDTSLTIKNTTQKSLTFYPTTYVDTESMYTDSTGMVVIIQNSLPKGGTYTDPTGKKFQYRIFWTRVINESAIPLELTIDFPADPFETLHATDSYFKLLLPPDTMTLNKETLYDYGATGLKAFLESGLNKPTMLQRIINPKDAFVFYIAALVTNGGNAVARAGLEIIGQNVFYRISGVSPEVALIPCGQIIFKK